MEQIRQAMPPRRDYDDPGPLRAAAPPAVTQIIDDLLDEIDEVLEDSAEAFVQGFVQKGGQ
jgi:ubiquitin-like protein Pup